MAVVLDFSAGSNRLLMVGWQSIRKRQGIARTEMSAFQAHPAEPSRSIRRIMALLAESALNLTLPGIGAWLQRFFIPREALTDLLKIKLFSKAA